MYKYIFGSEKPRGIPLECKPSDLFSKSIGRWHCWIWCIQSRVLLFTKYKMASKLILQNNHNCMGIFSYSVMNQREVSVDIKVSLPTKHAMTRVQRDYLASNVSWQWHTVSGDTERVYSIHLDPCSQSLRLFIWSLYTCVCIGVLCRHRSLCLTKTLFDRNRSSRPSSRDAQLSDQ